MSQHIASSVVESRAHILVNVFLESRKHFGGKKYSLMNLICIHERKELSWHNATAAN